VVLDFTLGEVRRGRLALRRIPLLGVSEPGLDRRLMLRGLLRSKPARRLRRCEILFEGNASFRGLRQPGIVLGSMLDELRRGPLALRFIPLLSVLTRCFGFCQLPLERLASGGSLSELRLKLGLTLRGLLLGGHLFGGPGVLRVTNRGFGVSQPAFERIPRRNGLGERGVELRFASSKPLDGSDGL
jgi:hypothetical protein